MFYSKVEIITGLWFHSFHSYWQEVQGAIRFFLLYVFPLLIETAKVHTAAWREERKCPTHAACLWVRNRKFAIPRYCCYRYKSSLWVMPFFHTKYVKIDIILQGWGRKLACTPEGFSLWLECIYKKLREHSAPGQGGEISTPRGEFDRTVRLMRMLRFDTVRQTDEKKKLALHFPLKKKINKSIFVYTVPARCCMSRFVR